MILQVNKLSFSYRSIKVLNDIKFQLNEGELLAILGPNGVGKTTLLRCINSILKPKAGSILIENKNILKMTQMNIARKIAYVAQRTESNRMTVFDTIYNPAETLLLKNAKAAGCKIISGLEMFINQAAEQFKLFTKQSPDTKLMRKVLSKCLSA